ncbi:hypothetical protein KFV02_06405 [Desulfohalobiaceae bacterium Ax17]|uniref:hypothetical protein n=1 Tax=Desulfovulcanus ferrireducens TaxID=2831190 RepID=UPI00207BA82B|nr:hypothetical protein [Desulfovulcanus ferrireducens]MBT8763562.1 hypothetical protein [Desulfovulcanus ferrireducens]
MKYNADVFCVQFPIVKQFIYHLICYRELNRVLQDLDLKNEFWTYTSNAHLLQCTILWCMVFGSDGCNRTHWKNLCGSDSVKLKDSFRQGLFKSTKLNQETWQVYWNKMNSFRGGYAAHRELEFTDPVPDFTTAQEVAYFYDQWIREVILPDVFDEPPLKKSAFKIQQEIRPLAVHFLSETYLLKFHAKQNAGH